MRLLTSSDDEGQAPELDPDAVRDLYPWPEGRRWVRAMMVTALDGAAVGPDGLSGTISSAADRLVFDAVRRLADAVVVGAETLRAEGYQPMKAKAEDAEIRAGQGLAPAPVLSVVSVSLDLPWHRPELAEAASSMLVITGSGADPKRLDRAREHAEVVQLPGQRVAGADVLDELSGRGLTRIVCEGGPRFLADLIAADLIDEADITVSPTFAGTEKSPVTPTIEPRRFRIAQVLTGDDFLMMRYLRRGES